MKELKMGNNTLIEEHVSKFKMLVTQLKLAKNDAVTEYFKESLPIALQKNVMSLANPPTTLDDWYKWAIKLHNNFIRMRSMIAKAQGKTGGSSNSALARKDLQEGKRTSKILFRAKTTREGSYGYGHRLHVNRGTK